MNQIYCDQDAFSRLDEADDILFYSRDRFVHHLDSTALSTIEDLIGKMITQERAVILDLMASWDSHIPQSVNPAEVVGLGLNENELSANKMLSRYIIHDLNNNPALPFEDEFFDVVLCTVSVDYMTRPVEVFKEVGRILKPSGLYLVIFSDRMFPTKAVKVWRESTEEERLSMVKDFFKEAKLFTTPKVYISKGKERPVDDKYAYLGIPSDPIYAVYAYKCKKEDENVENFETSRCGNLSIEEVEERKRQVGDTLCCPYCGETLGRWNIPQTVFTEWPNEYLYVCFNDECPYYVNGWKTMSEQGMPCSYRLMYDDMTNSCGPIPVFNNTMIKEDIVRDEFNGN